MKDSSAQDLTRGALPLQILRFTVPLILSNMLQVLFNMSDIAVIGRFAGSIALGSVGSTTILVGLFTGFLLGLGSGVNVLSARFIGAKKEDELSRTVHTSAVVCLVSGIFFLLLGVAASEPILRIMSTKAELLPGAVLYMRLYFLGLPGLALYNFGSAVFSAAGDTRRPLVYLSLSGVLNILLNLFFVIVLRLDVAGVAIASAISQTLSAVLVISALTRVQGPHRLYFSRLRVDRQKALSVLSLGLPTGIQYGVFAVANLFIQASVNSFPTAMVSGNAAAANADTLIYDTMAAFYTACATFMSQNYGAGNRKRMRQTFWLTTVYSLLAGGIPGVLLATCLGPAFLSLFTTDPEVVSFGMQRLFIMGLSYGFSAFMDNTIAASRSFGKTGVPIVLELIGSCAFRILWIFTIFRHFHTIPSLYLLYIFSWAITAAAELIYFAHVFRAMAPKEKT